MKESSIEGRRPRIAPLLLWPAKVGMENSRGGNFSVSFDKDRGDVRLNPALEGLLGTPKYEELKSLKNELRSISSIRMNNVLEILSESVAEHQLKKHPSVSLDVDVGHFEVFSSAVIFNAKFVGQAISEDLRQLRQIPIEGTALESLLKTNNEEQSYIDNIDNTELFNVVRSDPSQDKAIHNSRNLPGLVVEGPPGTGKSQTIVNIVADCMGRGESVLIVCQKRAALNVVRKRLAAENLEQRICGVVDINRDRQPVIRLIREQLESLFSPDDWSIKDYKTERNNLIAKSEALEKKINSFEGAIRVKDKEYGESYRDVICRLIEIEESGAEFIVVPELRSALSKISDQDLFELKQECSLVASDWLNSKYEGNPFYGLRQFNIDDAVLESLRSRLDDFRKIEKSRADSLSKYSSRFDDPDASQYQRWIDHSSQPFRDLSTSDIANIGKWHELFFDGNSNVNQLGRDIHSEISDISNALNKADSRAHDPSFFGGLLSMEMQELTKLRTYCKSVLATETRWTFLNLFRYFRKKKLKTIITQADGLFEDERIPDLLSAVSLEMKLRPLRLRLYRAMNNLEQDDKSVRVANLSGIRVKTAEIDDRISKVTAIAKICLECPRQLDAIRLFKNCSTQAISSFFTDMRAAVVRSKLREHSSNEIFVLREWFTDEWIQDRRLDILANKPLLEIANRLLAATSSIKAYQSFRSRTQGAPPLLFNVFSALRSYESSLHEVRNLDTCIENTIFREATLARKDGIKETKPLVHMNSRDMESLISNLREVRDNLLKVNKGVLANDIRSEGLGSQNDWVSITRLRGPRTKKLREFVNLGADLGLMKMRPVWLMNPEVVSQVLPLTAGLFDVVVFDEASQLLVDHSIPSLFRAKRVVISGDEKQMPPNNSFSRKMDFDDDDVPEEMDEDMSEAEISSIEEKWNQREIKDCPDLLALGRATLPSTTLEIHYRSEYNALIEFSNYAFYSGRLNVPAKHPISEIQRAKPVEVKRVDGLYIDQTNPKEGEAILDFLKSTWSKDHTPPSIGVVTFNLKQAELVETIIQHEADEDPNLSEAYSRESERLQDGEDMGFFVKNVENVQGDERDIILFSTTFGLNQHGSFRRNFGTLGHKGGEKRLNVAVTRARRKVVIFTSMPIDKISDGLVMGRKPNKPRDYLQAYLNYATKKSNGEIEMARRSAKQLAQVQDSKKLLTDIEDAFVRSVRAYIEDLGYHPIPVSEGDAFGLDLAIENPTTGLFALAIECDAPYHKLLQKAEAREIWRPSVLSRSIPVIHRITSVSWYHNRNHEQTVLKQTIEHAYNN